MKACGAALLAHLSGGQTTIAWLFKLKRADGTILGFTGHDRDIVYDAHTSDPNDTDGAITYKAASGFNSSADAAKADLSVPNLEATAFLNSPSITEADIRALKYDNAQFKAMVVNWNDLTMGHVEIRRGVTGDVKMKNGLWTAECRGMAAYLQSRIGATYGPICRATFGSGLNGIDMNSHWLCKVDVTLYRQNGSVSSVTDSRTIVPAAGLLQVGSGTPTNPAPSGWFNDGFITFTSGALNGASFEIKTWDGTTLNLFLAVPVLPAPGDTFQIEPGCNKTADDCQNKFNNIVNLRAETAIPGMDQILDNPSVQ